MKIKWNHRHRRLAGRAACPLLAFALAFGAACAAPDLEAAAQAVDTSRSCSLTVHPASGALAQELEQAAVVVDLYKVADAVPDSDYDTYTYQFTGAYSGLSLKDQPDSAAWDALAQKAAETAFSGNAAPDATGMAGSRIELPGCGLYLAAARGEGVADYTTTVTREDGKEQLATVVDFGGYRYTFAPSLVSLPGKEAQGGTPASTAGEGEWLYDLSVSLKPEQTVRFGTLEITKTLPVYQDGSDTDFVFQVEAVLNGQTVFSDVAHLPFSGPGRQTARVEKIPMGAQVTVTEVYSGAVYTAQANTQTTAVGADGRASVDFTNNYDSSNKGGGTVVNQFDYSTENGWRWTQAADGE